MNKYFIITSILYISFNITNSFPIPNPLYNSNPIQVSPFGLNVNDDIKSDQIFDNTNVMNDDYQNTKNTPIKSDDTKPVTYSNESYTKTNSDPGSDSDPEPESIFFTNAHKMIHKNTQTKEPTTVFIVFDDQQNTSTNGLSDKLFNFIRKLFTKKWIMKK
jgi:hypothetical protein